MKIVIVSSYYPPHLGGLEVVAYNHANLLAARQHEVTVVTSSVARNEVSYTRNGVTVMRYKAYNFIEKSFGVPFPITTIRYIVNLYKEVKKADIVHIHDVFYLSSFFAARAAKKYQKPVILMQHVEMIAHPSKLVMFVQKAVFATTGAYIFKQADKIITLNDRVDAFLLKQGVPRSKLIALANGVDTTMFSPVSLLQKVELKKKFGFSLDKKVVLFVGRFVPKKGFHKLFEARDSAYQIVFAGGDSVSKSDETTVFLGKMSQADLVPVYQAADIFVLPSEGEGFPLSIQEAMSSGLPIITTNDCGYVRYNFDKEKLMLLDDTQPAALKKAILSLVHNNNVLQTMGAYSRSYVVANFDWQVVISQLENLYNDCLTYETY